MARQVDFYPYLHGAPPVSYSTDRDLVSSKSMVKLVNLANPPQYNHHFSQNYEKAYNKKLSQQTSWLTGYKCSWPMKVKSGLSIRNAFFSAIARRVLWSLSIAKTISPKVFYNECIITILKHWSPPPPIVFKYLIFSNLYMTLDKKIV